MFELSDGRFEVGDPPLELLEHAELWLERGEHVSLVGPNGSGKTTLIETLAGRRPLAAGKLRTGHNVQVGYLSQHADELGVGGPPGQSVLEATQRATGLTPEQGARAARALPVLRRGGREAARRALRRRAPAAVDGDPRAAPAPNVLILDEPTNHLDIESREALEDALRAFQGALLLVSHDRALLDAVGTRTVAVEDGSLHSYIGGWPEYVRVREERRSGRVRTAGRVRHGAAASAAGSGRRTGRVRARHANARSRPTPVRESREGQAQAQADRPLEEPPERAGEGRARGRGGRGGAARARGRARRSGRLGDEVRGGQVRGPPHRRAPGGRGRLRAPGDAGRVRWAGRPLDAERPLTSSTLQVS